MINAKKAKRLRREARAITAGFPPHLFVVAGGNDDTAVLHPRCTRGVYQAMKRGTFTLDQLVADAMREAA